MKINRLNNELQVFCVVMWSDPGVFCLMGLNAKSRYMDRVSFSTVGTDGRLSLWLRFSATSLNMRLLIHIHALNCTGRWRHTHIHTLTDTQIQTHTMAHWSRVHFYPSPAVFANDALVFLSLNALQHVTSLQIPVVIILISSLKRKKKTKKFKSLQCSKTWTSQVA